MQISREVKSANTYRIKIFTVCFVTNLCLHLQYSKGGALLSSESGLANFTEYMKKYQVKRKVRGKIHILFSRLMLEEPICVRNGLYQWVFTTSFPLDRWQKHIIILITCRDIPSWKLIL
jgi:hypothetical protein